MDGTIADNQEDIKQKAVNCFFTFLNHVPEDFREVRVEELNGLLNYECIEEDRNMLMRRVTEEEVRKVVFSMDADKSPGPDGYTSEFFKASWGITGSDFVIAVQAFFDTGFQRRMMQYL